MAKGKKTGGKNFKKGNKYGKGRPKQKHETILIQKAFRDDIVTRTVELFNMPKSTLQEMSKDPNCTGLDYVIIGIINKAATKGSSSRFDVLLNRVIGKVKDVSDNNLTGNISVKLKIIKDKCKAKE